jgi:catechol 2,3-dioxygenase-like lactoylglutathione lyase family enzyme
MFQRIAPILPVRDVAAALARYKQLGFEGGLYPPTNADGRPFYGFVWRGDVRFHLTLADNLDPGANTSAAYIYVADLDELFARWSAASPDGELRKPDDMPWGMREMSYSDPDGNLLRIGRQLAPPRAASRRRPPARRKRPAFRRKVRK